MANRKPQWSKLSRASRDRWARIAQQQYGLSRRQARERYNRGTWSPGSRDPQKRVPLSVRKFEDSLEVLRARAIRNYDHRIGHYFKYNRQTVLSNIYDHASRQALTMMVGADEDELTAWASYQSSTSAPRFIKSVGWTDNGVWHNIFWYH